MKTANGKRMLCLLLTLLTIGGGVVAASAARFPQETVVSSSQATLAFAGGSGAGGDFLISTVGSGRTAPAIAYNVTDDEYLVVWSDQRNGDSDIYGQRYSAQGVPLGENVVISAGDGYQNGPAVAYNPANNEYLVVWGDSRGYGTTDFDIYGQRVGADGGLLDNPTTLEDETDPTVNFPISTADDYQENPAVVYNAVAYTPLAGEYLVVWEDTRNYDHSTHLHDVYGQRVRNDGHLMGNADPTVNLAIAADDEDQRHPDVAYNATEDEYLVVWDNWSASQSDIYGQLVTAGGALTGTQILVSTVLEDQDRPSAAWSSARNEYLVVWRDYRDRYDTGSDIYGQRLNADGSLAEGEIAISTANGDQNWPDLAYNPTIESHDQYLVVWEDGRDTVTSGNDVYGRRVPADGSMGGQDFVICDAVHDQYIPVVAYSSTSHQFLVVWYSYYDETEAHVTAQRVWWPGLLLGHSFDVATPLISQDYPAIAYNSRIHQYLVVWADERGGDAEIFGQRYNRYGLPVGQNVVIHAEAGDQTHPAVVYSPFNNRYLVVWQDEASGDIEAEFVSAQGTPFGTPITVSSGTEPRSRPAVAHNTNGLHNDFFVVFQVRQAPGNDDVYGRRILAYGALSSGDIAISDAPGNQGSPDLVYNLTENEYLVVWSDGRDDQGDIYGRIASAYGIPRGSELVIKQEADAQGGPTVAWNDADNRYLVVWHDYRDSGVSGADIYAQRLSADGSTYGTERTITDDTGDQQHPGVIYVGDLSRYRIIWQDNRNGDTGWDIYGQWMSSGGAVLGAVDLPVFRYVGWQQYPAIAYSPDDNRALTVWQDGRNGSDSDVYGRFGALDLNPPVAYFTVDPSSGPTGGAFAFNAWPSFDDVTPRGALMVRWDWNDDGAWDTPLGFDKYVTRTIANPGTYTVTLGVWDLGWNVDIVSHAVEAQAPVASSRAVQVSSAPTAALTISPTFGYAGDVFSFDCSGSAGAGALTARWDWESDGEFDTDFSAGLTATHTYTIAGDYTVRVEVKDGSGLTDVALQNATVLPGQVTGLEIAPAELTMLAGERTRLRAIAWDVYDNWMYHADVTWSVVDEAAGAIDSRRVFTASAQAGTYTDAIQAESSGVADTILVTIFWPYQIYLPLVLRQ